MQRATEATSIHAAWLGTFCLRSIQQIVKQSDLHMNSPVCQPWQVQLMRLVDQHEGCYSTEGVPPMGFVAGLPAKTPLISLQSRHEATSLVLVSHQAETVAKPHALQM